MPVRSQSHPKKDVLDARKADVSPPAAVSVRSLSRPTKDVLDARKADVAALAALPVRSLLKIAKVAVVASALVGGFALPAVLTSLARRARGSGKHLNNDIDQQTRQLSEPQIEPDAEPDLEADLPDLKPSAPPDL